MAKLVSIRLPHTFAIPLPRLLLPVVFVVGISFVMLVNSYLTQIVYGSVTESVFR
jgi:hypothetical protein